MSCAVSELSPDSAPSRGASPCHGAMARSMPCMVNVWLRGLSQAPISRSQTGSPVGDSHTGVGGWSARSMVRLRSRALR